ncbi:major capsid protein [Rhodococcus globerulus]|uniref:major capsid protein n=1 Tax=Rhodococcus globerulus TaxID=33008 RepID=UPI001C582E42|nr:major capsid protein [Rhodococcus globerulus]QXW04014.1 major capsid protein [Rhodococcus globerulus]
MAIFFDAPVEPDALTTLIRRVPTPSDNTLSTIFPTVYKESNTIDFAEIVQKNRTAKYRAFDGRIHVSQRDIGSEKRVPLAPLSSSIGVGEYERLQLEFARTQGTNKAALANAIYNDGENLTREILNRVELAWGDVLTDGKLSIKDDGFESEADYGLPANHSVTAATLWSNLATSAPLTDIAAWTDVWVDTNGAAPGSALTSRKVLRLLQRNKEIIDAVYGSTQGRTRVSITELNDLLAGESLPTFRAAYDTQLSVDDVNTRVMADDRVTFLPENPADLGFMAYGLSATALELLDSAKTEYSFSEAPGIVGVVIKDGPPFRQFTFVDAVGQPVLQDAKKLLTAKVA